MSNSDKTLTSTQMRMDKISKSRRVNTGDIALHRGLVFVQIDSLMQREQDFCLLSHLSEGGHRLLHDW